MEVVRKMFELEGVAVADTMVIDDTIKVEGRLNRERVHCPRCKCKRTIFKGKKKRRFHIPPVGARRGLLEVLLRRNQCVECKHAWWPQLPFADGKQRMSTSFVAHVIDLLKMGTVNDVAMHLRVGWDLVKDIHKNHLQGLYKEIDISELEYVSIDEFAIRKGHSYMTVVSDCRSGRIVHAVEGRKAADIQPFLKQLKKKSASSRSCHRHE